MGNEVTKEKQETKKKQGTYQDDVDLINKYKHKIYMANKELESPLVSYEKIPEIKDKIRQWELIIRVIKQSIAFGLMDHGSWF